MYGSLPRWETGLRAGDPLRLGEGPMIELTDIAHVGYHLSILTSAMQEAIDATDEWQVEMIHLAISEAVATTAALLSSLPSSALNEEESGVHAALYAVYGGYADYSNPRG